MAKSTRTELLKIWRRKNTPSRRYKDGFSHILRTDKDFELMINIIYACAILHNVCIIQRDKLNEECENGLSCSYDEENDEDSASSDGHDENRINNVNSKREEIKKHVLRFHSFNNMS